MFSNDQIIATLSQLPALEKARDELSVVLATRSEQAVQLLLPGLAWADLHELPIAHQMAIFFEVAGLTDYMRLANAAADPFAELLKLDAHPDYQEWKGGY